MEFAELFNILQNSDETDRIEAKAATHGIGKSFLETVSAFCNEPDLGGGYILLGVAEHQEPSGSKYVITGIADPDKLQNDITSQCRICFNIPVRPMVKVISQPQGSVILVYIAEAHAHEKPIYLKEKGVDGGAYRRIGSSDQVCTREDLDLLYQLRSRKKYDENQLESASFEDFEPEAIKLFRHERKKIKPDAPELQYGDEDLLKALRAIVTEKGATLPTIGGILLFGKEMALRRLVPLGNRIDYMLVEGREWMTDSDRRYTALEMSEALITGIPRLITQIMNDIPQVFALEEDEIRRKDNPIIPRKVIREAVVNALMHKDYRVASSIQIIKYANRTEFRNVGYSLKPQEQLGLPGSVTRNQILSQVLHDIHYAEAKGTGISTMREEMRKANLSVPLIESDRASNLFVLTLLPHHLFDKQDVQWLHSFKEHHLTDEEARTLIVIREKGSMSNAEYRTINGVDTLTASAHLRRLRDLGLLEQQGKGNTTFYTPTKKLLAPGVTAVTPGVTAVTPGVTAVTPGVTAVTPGVTAVPPGVTAVTPGVTAVTPGVTAVTPGVTDSFPGIPDEFPTLSEELTQILQKMGKRTSVKKIRGVIVQLCAFRPLTLPELVKILQRDSDHLRKSYISQMIEEGELEYIFPERPNHPQQAYRTKK
jgi:ATP-dependent DNA helicase RecG